MSGIPQHAPHGEERDWAHSGTDCCSPVSTCLLAWCVPCVVYGRTHHRIHKDPQLKDWSFVNADCLGFAALACCGCQWIIQMMQRGDVRKKYGLKGDGVKDCLCACCCVPCDLMQQDKESELREGERTGLVTAQPTSEKHQMQYPPAVHAQPAHQQQQQQQQQQQPIHDHAGIQQHQQQPFQDHAVAHPAAAASPPPVQQGYAQPGAMQYQQHPQAQQPPQY